LFKNEGLEIYDELKYAYYRMEIPCPLIECMISRFRLAHHQLSNECKAIQDIENQTTKPPKTKRGLDEVVHRLFRRCTYHKLFYSKKSINN
jgi:hypothetical protein